MDKTDEGEARSILDYELALSRMNGDRELYGEIVQVFLEDTPQQLAILRQASKERDRITIKRQAHSIKSAAANVGGSELSEIAEVLEAAAPESDFAEIALLETRLHGAFDRLKAKLFLVQP